MLKKLLVVPAILLGGSFLLATPFSVLVVASLFFGFKPDGTLIDSLMKFWVTPTAVLVAGVALVSWMNSTRIQTA